MSRLPHPTRISEYRDNEEHYPREIVESDGKIYLCNADGSLTLLSRVNPANIDADGYAVGGRLDLIARQNNPFTSVSKTFGLTGSSTDESEFLIEISRDGGTTWKDAKEDYMSYFNTNNETEYYAASELMFNTSFYGATTFGFQGMPLGGYTDPVEGEELINRRLRISIKPTSRIGHIDCIKHTYMCNGNDPTASILFDLEYCTVEDPNTFINILKDAPLKGGIAIGDGQYMGDGIHYFPEMKIGFGGDAFPQSSPMDPLVYRIIYRMDKPSSIGLICGIEFYGNDLAIPIGNGNYLTKFFTGKECTYIPLTQSFKGASADDTLSDKSGILYFNEGTILAADLFLGNALSAETAMTAINAENSTNAEHATEADRCQVANLANGLSYSASADSIMENDKKYPTSAAVYNALNKKLEPLVVSAVVVSASSWAEFKDSNTDKDVKYSAEVNITVSNSFGIVSNTNQIVLKASNNIPTWGDRGDKRYVDYILRYIYDVKISYNSTTAAVSLILYSKIKPTKDLTIDLVCTVRHNLWK